MILSLFTTVLRLAVGDGEEMGNRWGRRSCSLSGQETLPQDLFHHKLFLKVYSNINPQRLYCWFSILGINQNPLIVILPPFLTLFGGINELRPVPKECRRGTACCCHALNPYQPMATDCNSASHCRVRHRIALAYFPTGGNTYFVRLLQTFH